MSYLPHHIQLSESARELLKLEETRDPVNLRVVALRERNDVMTSVINELKVANKIDVSRHLLLTSQHFAN